MLHQLRNFYQRSPPKPKKQTKKVPLPKWGSEIDSAKLLEALDAFEKMRKEIKKPLTELARHRLYKNLCELSMDEDTQIAILEQSIFHCWQNVFRLHSAPLSKHKNRPEPTRMQKRLKRI